MFLTNKYTIPSCDYMPLLSSSTYYWYQFSMCNYNYRLLLVLLVESCLGMLLIHSTVCPQYYPIPVQYHEERDPMIHTKKQCHPADARAAAHRVWESKSQNAAGIRMDLYTHDEN